MSRKLSIKVVLGIIVVTFAAAVGLVYAAQSVIGTKEVSATVNIVTTAQFLKTCTLDDSLCTAPGLFTGDLPFGDMSRGDTKTVRFRVKNTQSSGGSGLLVDARIRFNDVVTKLERKSDSVLTGDVPNVGIFEFRLFNCCEGLSPNPPKDTDGRREGSGRGWVRELQGRWPGVLG